MSFKSSRLIIDEKKKEILRLLKEGTLTVTKEAPSSSSAEFWSNLVRIQYSNDKCRFEPFVQCITCQQILAYDPKNGTNSLNQHVQNCIKKTIMMKLIIMLKQN